MELFRQQAGRLVAAAIVDEHHFVVHAQRVERGVEPGEQRGQHGLLVVDRNNDGKQKRSGHEGNQTKADLMTRATVSHTRSTSASRIAGNSGRVTVRRPMSSASGKSPSAKPSRR